MCDIQNTDDIRLTDLGFVLLNRSNGFSKRQYYDVDNEKIVDVFLGKKYFYKSEVFRIVGNSKEKFDDVVSLLKNKCYIKLPIGDIPLVI